jgi:hypothetical protein
MITPDGGCVRDEAALVELWQENRPIIRRPACLARVGPRSLTPIVNAIGKRGRIWAMVSKCRPAEPRALVLEPLEAACPCRFSSAALPR